MPVGLEITEPELFGNYDSWKKLMYISVDGEIIDSMSALEIPNNGCFVRIFNKENNVNSVLYIENVHIVETVDEDNVVTGRYLENNV